MKLENIIAEKLSDAIKKDYGFIMSKDRALFISRMMINQFYYVAGIPSKNTVEIMDLYERWYKTVKLPEKDIQNHSAFYFARYMCHFHDVILLKKDSLLYKILKFLNKR